MIADDLPFDVARRHARTRLTVCVVFARIFATSAVNVVICDVEACVIADDLPFDGACGVARSGVTELPVTARVIARAAMFSREGIWEALVIADESVAAFNGRAKTGNATL